MAQFRQTALGLAAIFFFYSVGHIVHSVSGVTLPAPLFGMLLLFIFLVWRGREPIFIAAGAKPLLGHMAVLFVPAVIGVALYWESITAYWASLFVAIVLSTIFSLGVAAYLAQRVLKSKQPLPQASEEAEHE